MNFKWKECDNWFVNLDERGDRLNHIQRQFENIGAKASRERGMLPEEYRGNPKEIRGMWERPQKGAIGCHFSQRSIIERGANDGHTVGVFEDDCVFCDDFLDRMEMVEVFLADREWDVFWLGATFHLNPPVWHKDDVGRDIECTDCPWIVRTYGIWSTYAWIVNGESAGKVLDMIDQNTRHSIGIDALMIKIQPQLQTFCFVPGCVKQRDDSSNIGVNQDGKPAFTKFSNFERLGPFWWQSTMNDFDPISYDWAEAKVSND